MTAQVNIFKTSQFLKSIIEVNASEKELEWMERQEDKLQNHFEVRSFYLAFSTAARYIRKNDLQLSRESLNEADLLCKGFQPQFWNLLQCVRTYLLLMLPAEDAEAYEKKLTLLHESADIDEQVTLYAALPILPHPLINTKRAAEGIRTNITDVFDAIALDNPYPAQYLKESAWNQMVLKAVFMQRPLYRIYGTDERANPELAGMLIDFAHERWAANREVLPELWRFIGPFLTSDRLTDIQKTTTGGELEKRAGLLACAQSKLPEAQQLLVQYPDIQKKIKSGEINWTLIGEEYRAELQK